MLRPIATLAATWLALAVISSGCSRKTDSDSSEQKSATVKKPAANQTTGGAAASAAQQPVAFDGLPLSATKPATAAMIDESSEHWDLESTTPAHDLAVRATESDPGSIMAWLHRANAALSPDESAHAAAKAEALKAGANPVELALLEVRLAREKNDTDGALQAAKKLTQLAPKSPEAHLVLSRVYTLRGEDVPARAAATEAAKLDPESLSAHALLGESYTFREPRDLAKAEHHFKKTTELRPKIAATFVSLGDVYRARLDLQAASAEYGKAMAADPRYPIGPIKRGHVNSFLGNYEQARADYDAGIALGNPRTALSLSSYRAFVSIHEGKPEAAIAELDDLLGRVRAAKLPAGEQNDLSTSVLENRAIIALHIADQAADEKSRTEASKRAGAAIAELVAEHQRIGAAAKDAQVAHQAKVAATYWHARLELAVGAFEKAVEHAEAYASAVAADTSPRKLERYHELRGLIALHRQKYAEAVEHLRKADLQTVVFAKYHLALALAAAGRADEARKLFREVADWSFNSPDYALLRKLASDKASAS